MKSVSATCMLLFLAVLAAASSVEADLLTYEFALARSDFHVGTRDGYDILVLPRGAALGPPGSPHLPAVPLSFVLPQGARITESHIESTVWRELPGTYQIYPVQPPRPLSQDEVEFVLPRADIYARSDPFPREPLARVRAGNAGGFRIVGCTVTPFRYRAAERRLAYLERAELVIEYIITGRGNPPQTPLQIESMASALKARVRNPHDVDMHAPPDRAGRRHVLQDGEPGEYGHVIITSEALAPYLEPLRDWRTKQGLPSKLKTVAEIAAAYPGWDEAEQMRNFIIDAHETWGTMYITLAGDLGVVPARDVYMADTTGSQHMPVDLYFSDLDGTWDSNGDHFYGEHGIDTIDMYSDVFVGRASIETQAEAETFVSKVLTYEKTPPPGYATNCLLPGVELWPPYGGDIVNDSIAACTPPPWNDIMLYEDLGNIDRPTLIAAINDGAGFCHYAAHGNQDGVYFAGGDTLMSSVDAINLVNGTKLGIHNSIACIPGAFDSGDIAGDCFAEHLMNNPNGGAVAAIMNARVGLGTPPTMGPSEMLSLEFYRKTFRENLFRVGMAHGVSKDVYVPPRRRALILQVLHRRAQPLRRSRPCHVDGRAGDTDGDSPHRDRNRADNLHRHGLERYGGAGRERPRMHYDGRIRNLRVRAHRRIGRDRIRDLTDRREHAARDEHGAQLSPV